MKTIAAFAVLLTGCASTSRQKSTVLFMCPYGGAKSVIAASYFNRAAETHDLPFVAVAVAAETPYDAVPQPVAEFLQHEGFDVASFKPREVTEATSHPDESSPSIRSGEARHPQREHRTMGRRPESERRPPGSDRDPQARREAVAEFK
jgi:hypothetical protein